MAAQTEAGSILFGAARSDANIEFFAHFWWYFLLYRIGAWLLRFQLNKY
jgi:hypothetical protein